MKKIYSIFFALVMSFSSLSTMAQEFQDLLKSAENGDVDAQTAVAWSYLTGDMGVAKDSSKGFKWAMKAAVGGSSFAECFIGICYFSGDGVSQDVKKAVEWWFKSAEHGCSDGQHYVSLCYSNGTEIERNHKKAMEWGLKAALSGHPHAQAQVGYLYTTGEGIPVNYREAIKWYQKAMAQNVPNAYNGMAYMYIKGHGVQKSVEKAFEMIDKAIELSTNDVQFLDTKGELYARIGNKEKAYEIKRMIEVQAPNYLRDEKTTFYKYIQGWQNGDVDYVVPKTNANNPNTFAVVIAEENYVREAKVPHALRDGEFFIEYCKHTLGIPESNIRFVENGTLNAVKYSINWLKNVMGAYNGDVKVIFYYAGHGIPDESNNTAYLLPVDGYGAEVSTGYSLKDLYTALGEMPAKSVMVFLDACFSGTKRDGEMMASARGISIKAKAETPKGNMVVFSATQGNETAYPYEEKEHGMFTYYILEKLQKSKGEVTLGELSKYVTTQVSRQSIVVNGKPQTPTLSSATALGDSWKDWKLK